MKNLSSFSALALASVLGFGLLRTDDPAPPSSSTTSGWEHGVFCNFWDKPDGFLFYERFSWSEPGSTIEVDDWEPLLAALGLDPDSNPDELYVLRVLNHLAQEGWELVETTAAPAFQSASGMWMHDSYWYFRRPVR